MKAYSLPEHHLRATVVEVEEHGVNVIIWIRPEGSDDDSWTFRVSFQKEGEQVDPEMINVALDLTKGDLVDLSFVELVDGESIVRLGRSLARH